MNWLKRMFTLPKSSNSLKDVLGHEWWQRIDSDLESVQAFSRACTDYLNQHPEQGLTFARELAALLTDSARLVQSGLSTSDPFYSARKLVREFARKWGLDWSR